MKKLNSIFVRGRRRFLGLIAALGAMASWSAMASRKHRLSRHEASYYRKGKVRNS